MLLSFRAIVDHGPEEERTFWQVWECVADMPPDPVLEAMVRDVVARKKPGKLIYKIVIVGPQLSENRIEIKRLPADELADLVHA